MIVTSNILVRINIVANPVTQDLALEHSKIILASSELLLPRACMRSKG
jgi:hypothetical protein